MTRSQDRSRTLVWRGIVLLVLLSGGFPLAPGEAATTLVVTSLTDPGTGGCDTTECTLREAIAAAQDGDTITFTPALFTSGFGTIKLTSGELVITHDMTIAGPGRGLLKIHGKRASRVFRITAGVVASIEKVTIMAGRADSGGGGISNEGTLTLVRSMVSGNKAYFGGGGISNEGTLTLVRSMVSGNKAYFGGGLSNTGTLTLVRSTVSGNTARAVGGGLSNAGTLTLVRSMVSNNTAGTKGGGLFNDGGTLTLQRSTVSGNTAGAGGGISNDSGTLTLQRSTVSGNTAGEGSGGGIDGSDTLMLVRSTVSGNTAGFSGGGISNTGTLMLVRSTVSGNTAGFSGGGLVNTYGTLMLRHSTVSGNTAAREGGGLFHAGGIPGRGATLHTTIVVGNTAISIGPDCAQYSESLPSTLLSRGYNLVGAGTGCPSDAAQGDLTVDPTLVLTQVLGHLQDNGGPTFTHALLPGSPAIDVGEPGRCRGTDQRGVPRPQGARCDIGAFELEQP